MGKIVLLGIVTLASLMLIAAGCDVQSGSSLSGSDAGTNRDLYPARDLAAPHDLVGSVDLTEQPEAQAIMVLGDSFTLTREGANVKIDDENFNDAGIRIYVTDLVNGTVYLNVWDRHAHGNILGSKGSNTTRIDPGTTLHFQVWIWAGLLQIEACRIKFTDACWTEHREADLVVN